MDAPGVNRGLRQKKSKISIAGALTNWSVILATAAMAMRSKLELFAKLERKMARYPTIEVTLGIELQYRLQVPLKLEPFKPLSPGDSAQVGSRICVH